MSVNTMTRLADAFAAEIDYTVRVGERWSAALGRNYPVREILIDGMVPAGYTYEDDEYVFGAVECLDGAAVKFLGTTAPANTESRDRVAREIIAQWMQVPAEFS